MIRLGKIFRKTYKCTYLVRSKELPDIGSLVFLRNGKIVGKVVDIFGPVVLPYIEIQSFGNIELLDNVVYYKRGVKDGKKKMSEMRK